MLVPCGADAQDERRVQLAYERAKEAERCPDATELGDRVAEQLGYDPFDAAASERLKVQISRARGEFLARIALENAAGEIVGERELGARGEDCSELAAALALAIAIAIDPVRASAPRAEPGPRPAEPKPEAKPAPTPAPSAPPPKAPEPRAETQPAEVVLAAGASIAAGSAPALAPGVWVFGGVRFATLSLGIEGRADLPASKSVAGGTVRASLLLASLLPCVHSDPLFACAVGSLGALQGSGEGVSSPRNATTVFARAGARLGVDIPLGKSLGLWAFGDLAATLTRTSLELDGREAWESPPLGGNLGLGVRGRL